MKASELIAEMAKEIARRGDFDVVVTLSKGKRGVEHGWNARLTYRRWFGNQPEKAIDCGYWSTQTGKPHQPRRSRPMPNCRAYERVALVEDAAIESMEGAYVPGERDN